MRRAMAMCLALALLICLGAPALASWQGEWQSSLAWSDPINGEEWYWASGLRLQADLSFSEEMTFFLRGWLGLDSDSGEWRTELERAYLQYDRASYRLRLGRQAIGWGAGWFFRPTDLVTPRIPLAADETRPGKDLAVLTWFVSPLTNLELIAGEDLYGLRNGWRIGGTNLRLLGLAEPGGINSIGLDCQGGLGGFYAEAAWEWTDEFAAGRPAAMLGWQKTLGGENLLYLEYLHDERGRFYGGRNYLAAGLEIPRDELTTYTLAVLGNLDDRGATLIAQGSWLLTDTLDLAAGVSILLGPEGTEFYNLAGGARAGANVQAKWYF